MAFPLLAEKVKAMQDARNETRAMLRTREASQYLSVSTSRLEKLRLTGGGPRYLKLGKTVVYDPADLDAWLNAHRRVSTSKAA